MPFRVEAAAAATAEAEAEARAERLTRKFAHEAKAAADDALTRNMLSPCSGSGSSRRTNHRRARPTIRVTPCRCASCLLLQVCGIEPCPIGVESWSRVCACADVCRILFQTILPDTPCSMYWSLTDPPQCVLCQVHAVVVRTPAATCLPEQAGRWQQQAASKQAGRRRSSKQQASKRAWCLRSGAPL